MVVQKEHDTIRVLKMLEEMYELAQDMKAFSGQESCINGGDTDEN